MPRKLKVYGGNLDGRRRAIMAAHSIKEFCAATRIGRDWLSETGNAEEIAQAMSEPGAVFVRAYNARGMPWVRFERQGARPTVESPQELNKALRILLGTHADSEKSEPKPTR